MAGGPTGPTALLLVVQFFLMTVAIVVLGAAINWPASLDEPAGVVLPAITEQRGAVMVGYGAYLLYSILFVPLALLLYHVLAGRDAPSPLLTVAGFAIVSALARTLGIVRWFVLMPFLAEMYLDPRASDATRASVSLVYAAFNEYAGSVGDLGRAALRRPLRRADLSRDDALGAVASPDWLRRSRRRALAADRRPGDPRPRGHPYLALPPGGIRRREYGIRG
jgi:hypothetical protein